MKKLLLMATSAMIFGCANNVPKELVATGGSKADGIVELSYQYSERETPVVNKAEGLKTAEKRCQAWGYKRADPFGGEKTVCSSPGTWTECGTHLVTIQYQCLDE